MPDIATISALLSNIKAAANRADLLKSADISPEKTELGAKIAEMSSALALAETAADEIRRVLEEKEKRIRELEGAREVREGMCFRFSGPDETREDGVRGGASSCSHCREISRKAVHLHFAWPQSVCPYCRTAFAEPQAPPTSDV